MDKRPEIDMAKQSPQGSVAHTKFAVHDLQEWNEDIKSICKQLVQTSDAFNAEKTYKSVETFISKHKRWLYSTVSTFLFDCDEQDLSTFISNLDGLREYAYQQISLCSPNDKARIEQRKEFAIAIDKLWDHSNLAQTQNQSLHDSDKTFAARFDKNLIPFKAEFTREMNMQFISLIAIFTALSFIVFGGISSLDNLFGDVGKVPILELMIVGGIWSFCILNLVFVFIYFVAKLTKLSIKSSNWENAALSQRYPFFIWSNFLVILILAICCWLHFLDYADAGGWLLSFSKTYSVYATIGGIALIGIVFGTVAWLLIRKPKQKRTNPTNGVE
jgi:hypothetical protein